MYKPAAAVIHFHRSFQYLKTFDKILFARFRTYHLYFSVRQTYCLTVPGDDLKASFLQLCYQQWKLRCSACEIPEATACSCYPLMFRVQLQERKKKKTTLSSSCTLHPPFLFWPPVLVYVIKVRAKTCWTVLYRKH